MTQLILDAAFPPVGEFDWEGVLRAAGAQGSMVYVFDPYIAPNRWSPDYVRALQAAGFGILPVYVTFNQPIGHARQVMAEYGWNSGPLMGDIETGSFPSTATFQAWCQDLRNHGYAPVAYGTASTLDSYRRYADKGFLASYRNLHTVQPVPSLDGVSYDGWQYSDQIFINGVEVDASVTSISLIGAGGGPTPASPDFFGTSGGDDTMVALSTPGGRLDFIYVGTDGHVYHRWQNGKINDLAVQVESWGGGVVKVAACYTDGGATIAVFAAIATGDVWFKELAISDGHVINDWAVLGGNTDVLVAADSPGTPGPAGPPGPKGDKGDPGVVPSSVTVTGGTLNLK